MPRKDGGGTRLPRHSPNGSFLAKTIPDIKNRSPLLGGSGWFFVCVPISIQDTIFLPKTFSAACLDYSAGSDNQDDDRNC
jgi:hypothetical protein